MLMIRLFIATLNLFSFSFCRGGRIGVKREYIDLCKLTPDSVSSKNEGVSLFLSIVRHTIGEKNLDIVVED